MDEPGERFAPVVLGVTYDKRLTALPYGPRGMRLSFYERGHSACDDLLCYLDELERLTHGTCSVGPSSVRLLSNGGLVTVLLFGRKWAEVKPIDFARFIERFAAKRRHIAA